MTGFTKTTVLKAVFTPQVLLSFLLCSVLAFRYFRPETVSEKASTPTVLPADTSLELVNSDYELVLYDSNQLQQAKFVTITSEDVANAKIMSLIDALKNEYPTLWPASLVLASVFEVSADGSSQMVLDFNYSHNSEISVNDEWRLLKSITGTLNRAGYQDVKILINQKESDAFINFIKLN